MSERGVCLSGVLAQITPPKVCTSTDLQQTIELVAEGTCGQVLECSHERVTYRKAFVYVCATLR